MGITIFISYATEDSNRFRIREISEKLYAYPQIDEVLFWEGDVKDDIVDYMNENIPRCDIFILFCSEESLLSKAVNDEWKTAYNSDRKIVPVFESTEYIPPIFKHHLGCKFNPNDFDGTIIDIFKVCLRRFEYSKKDKKIEEVIVERKREEEDYRLLKWSPEWRKKWLKYFPLKKGEKLSFLLDDPDKWQELLNRIKEDKGFSNWLEKSFYSIRIGSKGLYKSQFLDYALISVPPPLKLFKTIADFLENELVVSIAAPSGWGKSRLALWIALYYSLKKWNVYYISNPTNFKKEKKQVELQHIAQKRRTLMIVDDFHLLQGSSSQLDIWEDLRRIIVKNDNCLLIIQTESAETKNMSLWLEDSVIINSNEYLRLLISVKEKWVTRFLIWFNWLNGTILNKYIYIDHLADAQNAPNPWAFVSVMVDIKSLIKKNLSIRQQPDLVTIFSIINLGYTVSYEKGLTPLSIYKGFSWIYKNNKELWNILAETGGGWWDLIERKKRGLFLALLINQIKLWRKAPKDQSETRLLGSRGPSPNLKVPIEALHTGWWSYALNDLWTNDPEWKIRHGLKKICELVVAHASPQIFGNWLSYSDNCVILKDCKQLEVLSLTGTQVTNIESLKTCKNLKNLYFPGNKVADINPLSACRKLQEIDLNWATEVSSLSPLKYCRNLLILKLNRTKINDLKPLSSCTKLQILNLNRTKIKDNDIKIIGGFVNLRELLLSETQITNLNYLKDLTKLRLLDISRINISDINILKNFPDLEELRLNETKVSNLEPLQNSKKLKILNICNTEITRISELMPLKECNNLEKLNYNFEDTALADFLDSLDKVNVVNHVRLREERNIRYLFTSIGETESDPSYSVLRKPFEDAGIKMTYLGVQNNAEKIIEMLKKKEFDGIGFSVMAGEFISIILEVIQFLRNNNLDYLSVGVGGVIPQQAIRILRNEGVSGIFLPGDSVENVIDFVVKSSLSS